MPSFPRQYRLVVQRIAIDDAQAFLVVAYGEGAASVKLSKFESLTALMDALDSVGVGVTLDLRTAGSIVFAGEVAMDEAQLRALGLL